MSPNTDGIEQRKSQVETMAKIVYPVLLAASENRLQEAIPSGALNPTAATEAVCRCLAGLAPWLDLPEDESHEGKQRREIANLARESIRLLPPLNRVKQNLVEGGLLAQAVLRAPRALWKQLDERSQTNLVDCLRSTRRIVPSENNWLIFSAAVEAALWVLTRSGQPKPIKVALKKFRRWYVGEGLYKDGESFLFNYYNSIVIVPLLWETLEAAVSTEMLPHEEFNLDLQKLRYQARRQAEFQESLISPEGTFPVMGRSSTYRFAALQTLGLCALRKNLPKHPGPAATRAALTAVINNMTTACSFSKEGWLNIGAIGVQPNLSNYYINTGSVYACCLGFVPLGLPANDPFWQGPSEDWTQKRIWSGQNPELNLPEEEPEDPARRLLRIFTGKVRYKIECLNKRITGRI